MLIVLRLLRAEDDEYLHDQLLRLNKSEARVILLYATKYDNAVEILYNITWPFLSAIKTLLVV